jgi:hypothetical protein
MADPTLKPCDFAYPESTTATTVSASAAVNKWPETSDAKPSDPGGTSRTSVPYTVYPPSAASVS